MKLISWNIDSLNAALTSDSARAKISQEVLQTLVRRRQDGHCHSSNQVIRQRTLPKHLETSLRSSSPWQYENTWRLSSRTGS